MSVVTDGSIAYTLSRCRLMHTVDSCVNEGWFSCDQVIMQMCFMCLLAKRLSEKKTIFGFLFPQAVQKH